MISNLRYFNPCMKYHIYGNVYYTGNGVLYDQSFNAVVILSEEGNKVLSRFYYMKKRLVHKIFPEKDFETHSDLNKFVYCYAEAPESFIPEVGQLWINRFKAYLRERPVSNRPFSKLL